MSRNPPDIGDLIALAIMLPIVLAWYISETLWNKLKG